MEQQKFEDLRKDVVLMVDEEIKENLKKIEDKKKHAQEINSNYCKIIEIFNNETKIEDNKKELKKCAENLIRIFSIILYGKVIIFDYKFFHFLMINILMKDKKDVERIICFLLNLNNNKLKK